MSNISIELVREAIASRFVTTNLSQQEMLERLTAAQEKFSLAVISGQARVVTWSIPGESPRQKADAIIQAIRNQESYYWAPSCIGSDYSEHDVVEPIPLGDGTVSVGISPWGRIYGIVGKEVMMVE